MKKHIYLFFKSSLILSMIFLLSISILYQASTPVEASSYYVAYLKAKSSTGQPYLTYQNATNPLYDGYTTGSYAKDGAFIGRFNGKIRVMQAGALMDFNPADVTLVEYDRANISHYYIEGEYLYHQFYYGSSGKYNTYRVGYKQSYLKENMKYYSYDGHYFYTSYPKMINDYQKGSRNQSVNYKNPYYNYYQYLPHRSQTTLKETDFNTIVNKKLENTSSKLKNTGKSFISYQNKYGVNALLMFGVATNESAWGTSSIAKNKNNLFGHGAVDSNPYYGALGYKNVSNSIQYHAYNFLSKGYFDYEDWRYNGSHLGDKLSGVNVRYASDPYWGEKAASIYYYYDEGKSDFNKYKIGIVKGILKDFKIYKEASTSHVLERIGNQKSPQVCNLPVIILGSIKDDKGDIWYKVQNDTALNSSRTGASYANLYEFSRDYAYIPAKDIIIVWNGNGKKENSDTSSQVSVPITRISMKQSSLQLNVGKTATLKTTINPQNTTNSKKLIWTSSHKKVATVDSKGKVKALAVGQTNITVKTINGKMAKCKITVKNPITKISLNKKTISLIKGKSYNLKATLFPTKTTDSKKLTWTSSNPKIITVKNGKVKAKNYGAAIITAKTVNGKKATCKITVKRPINKIKLNHTAFILRRNHYITLKAIISPSSTNKGDVLKWTSSNKKVATVSSKGKVMAKKKGTTIITVKTYNGKIAKCKIKVK